MNPTIFTLIKEWLKLQCNVEQIPATILQVF